MYLYSAKNKIAIHRLCCWVTDNERFWVKCVYMQMITVIVSEWECSSVFCCTICHRDGTVDRDRTQELIGMINLSLFSENFCWILCNFILLIDVKLAWHPLIELFLSTHHKKLCCQICEQAWYKMKRDCHLRLTRLLISCVWWSALVSTNVELCIGFWAHVNIVNRFIS